MFKIKGNFYWKTKNGRTQTKNVEFCDEWTQPAKAQNGNNPAIHHRPVNSIEQYESLIYGYPNSVRNYIKRVFDEEGEDIDAVNMLLESHIQYESIEFRELNKIPNGMEAEQMDNYIITAMVRSEDAPEVVRRLSVGKLMMCTKDR